MELVTPKFNKEIKVGIVDNPQPTISKMVEEISNQVEQIVDDAISGNEQEVRDFLNGNPLKGIVTEDIEPGSMLTVITQPDGTLGISKIRGGDQPLFMATHAVSANTPISVQIDANGFMTMMEPPLVLKHNDVNEWNIIGSIQEQHECACGGTGSCGDEAVCHTCHCGEHESPNSDIEVVDSTGDLRIEIFRNRSEMECRIIDKATGEIIRDRLPVYWKARENTLDYLSVSKIKAYEDCPACFYRQYMSDEDIEEDSGNYYTKFGTILHEVVEKASGYFLECGILVNPITIYDEVWTANPMPADDENSAFATYLEGKGLIEDYFRRNPVDKRTDIAKLIEYEWRGELGGCTFGLMVDYAGVYKNDPMCGVIKDYKTNRMPFTPSELDESFQLKIYELIIRRHVLPEVERWTTGYELFRYGWQQCPPRTMEDLLDAERYVANMWSKISADNIWEEKLNRYCGFRKCRFTCKTYNDYVSNPKRHLDAIMVPDITNLAEVDKQRELMTSYEKIAKGRKDDCAGILKSAIENAMKQNKVVVVDGQQLELYSQGKDSYNYYDTRNVLLAHNALDILDGCLTIGKTKMDDALKKRPDLKMVLSQCTTTNYASPYIVRKKYTGK